MVDELAEQGCKQGVGDIGVEDGGIRTRDGIRNYTLVGALRISDRGIVSSILSAIGTSTVKVACFAERRREDIVTGAVHRSVRICEASPRISIAIIIVSVVFSKGEYHQ